MSLGSKADNLEILRSLYPGNVPDFFVIPFADIIADHQRVMRKAQKVASDVMSKRMSAQKAQRQINSLSKEAQLDAKQLRRTYKTAKEKGWEKISIRTSALSEDGDKQSFAGQYVSFVDLKLTPQNLAQYIHRCYVSLFSEQVINYASSHNLRTIDIGGSVIIQEMFYGGTSGVLFTEDGAGNMTFVATDSWRNTIVEGTDGRTIKLPRTTLASPYATRQMHDIAAIAIALEKHYEQPLDIEWSYNNSTIMLLQVRPQTTHTTAYTLNWDATNISENYPGITLPLTYSFVKNLYSHVYPSFFRLMGMREQKLRKNSWVFDNALGYIDGRIYYRIDNWYEIIRLIPGTRNQEFFEAMLNPAKKQASDAPRQRPPITLSMLILSARFAWLLLRSRTYSRRFIKTFARTYEEAARLNWDAMSAEASLDHLHHMRQKLLIMWGVPILNDIRVMIFHGIFKTIILKDADQKTYLEHLAGLADQASIKPLESLHALGKTISTALANEKVDSLTALKSTSSWPIIEEQVREFIDAFGGRTPDELKLENPRLGESIQDVTQLAYASRDAKLTIKTTSATSRLQLPFIKQLVANFVIRNMRSAIDYRERFRFNRAQIFGTARQVYLAIGTKLHQAAIIDSSDDIFWLSEHEVEDIVRGHSWSYRPTALIADRKAMFRQYEATELRLRVTGEGIIAPAATFDSTPSKTGVLFAGTGVAAGRVTAPAIVVRTFDPSLDVTGKILVVKHVDPGWTLLLVQAAGVISEQGNALSHVAIVSREIKIPAIVGIPGAIDAIKTGSLITINGTTGEIEYAAS